MREDASNYCRSSERIGYGWIEKFKADQKFKPRDSSPKTRLERENFQSNCLDSAIIVKTRYDERAVSKVTQREEMKNVSHR